MTTHDGPPPGPTPGAPTPPRPPAGASSGGGWRSEEDFVLARLAVSLGVLDEAAVREALAAQGAALARGVALGLGQVLVQSGRLRPEQALLLRAELARAWCPCPGCGAGRYLAAGPTARTEPCRRCGGPLHVPPAGSSMTASAIDRRDQALGPDVAPPSAVFRGQAGPLTPALEAGQAGVAGAPQIGGYAVEAAIAKGGMGAIYRARHVETDRVVALKVLLAGDKASAKQQHRFQREARAQLELEHPNIVKAHEAGEQDGVLWVTFDLVDGPDLARAYPGLELPERVRVLAQVARAVHHAHEHGYVHRDLKPANVLLRGGRHPLVTDFGLAKNLEGQTQLTGEGMVLGTPFYLAPEQAVGQVDRIGPRTDVWALGVMLYELTTGVLPFVAEASLELYTKIVEEHPRPFAEHGVLEPVLELIALRALAKDPEARYASAEALAVDLERWLAGESPLAARESSVDRVARQVMRHRRSLSALAALVLGTLVVLVGLSVGFRGLLRRWRAEQARVAHAEACARAQGALEQASAALAAADPLAPEAATLAALDAALALGRAALASAPGDAPGAPGRGDAEAAAALAPHHADALVARARAALALRCGLAAGEAAAAAEEALALAPRAPAAARPARLVLARAALRRGDLARAAAALDALGAAAPDGARGEGAPAADGAEEAGARALLALARGEPAAALAALEAAPRVGQGGEPPGAAAGPSVEALRGRALLALGRAEEARAALDLAVANGAALDAADAWLAGGGWREAGLALGVALARAPRRAPVARRVAAVALAHDRPLAALAALAALPTEPATEALRLAARRALGEDVRAALAAPLDDPLARRLAAEAAALARRGAPADAAAAPGPWDAAVARGDPGARAGRAAWAAARGDLDAARADLAALGDDALAAVPRDVPPSPAQAALARDVAAARLALGDRAGADAAAREALRADPHDLAAAALRASAGALDAAGLRAVAHAARERLDGPLGRGLLLARLAAWHEAPALAGEARALLDAARAAAPPLEAPLAAEVAALEALAGGAPLAAAPGPPALAPDVAALWSGALPPVRLRPRVADADRERARALFATLGPLPREDNERAIALGRELVALDPTSLAGRHELAVRLERREDDDGVALGYLEEVEVVRLDPLRVAAWFHEARRDWRKAFRYRRLPPDQEMLTVVARAPEVAANHVPRLFAEVLAVLYPSEEEWSPADAAAVAAHVDWALARDPTLGGLLWLRAALAGAAGRDDRAARDLDLAGRLVAARPVDPGAIGVHWHLLWRAWVLAPHRPEEALRLLAQVPAQPPADGFAGELSVWVQEDPRWAPIRTSPGFQAFARGLRVR